MTSWGSDRTRSLVFLLGVEHRSLPLSGRENGLQRGRLDSRSDVPDIRKTRFCEPFEYPLKSTLQEAKLNVIQALIAEDFTEDLIYWGDGRRSPPPNRRS